MRTHSKEATVADYFQLTDRVNGDDKLCGAPTHLVPYFNALTMKAFFNSIGMEFTDGQKGEIVSPHSSIPELSFLKRTFRYHPMIKRVMCPLSKETLLNSIQWYDTRKDMDIVLDVKLRSFQREMYLHHDGHTYVKQLQDFCKAQDVPFPLLSDEYMLHMYTEEPDEAFKLYLLNNNKNYFI
jgi:hypothetical protein